MPDLHGWITQQIDDRERLARRAAALCGCHPSAPVWSFHDGDEPTDGRILVVDDPHPTLKRKISRKWSTTYEGLFMAEHIVANDPHAVLRRCAADRKILEVHAPRGGDWDPYACLGCGSDSEYGVLVDHTNDCETLLALAEGYGLTDEQRAELDRPEPERPDYPGKTGNLIHDSIASIYARMHAEVDATVDRMLLTGDGTGPTIGFGIGDAPREPSPKEKAIRILDPELKKIPGYLPTTNPEA
jgi:hypothetical protein